MTKVLVVDDERPIVEAVAYNLRKEGYEVVTADDAAQCLEAFRRHRPALIILDVMLPSGSGFDVCRRIHRESDVPIILLTARAGETDRVDGLDIGADDYVTKPFSMRELLARVRTILRRGPGDLEGGMPGGDFRLIESGTLRIDPARHEVTVAGRPVELSLREFSLLRFLASHPDKVFSRQTLLDRVWGTDVQVEERTVNVHMRWLREKIEPKPSEPQRLLTVRGVGYKFASERADDE